MSRYAAALLGALAVVAASQAAVALPKQNSNGRCLCMCAGIQGPYPVMSYDSKGYGCAALNGTTCNVDDPQTGGVQTGTNEGCTPDTTSTSLRLPPSILESKGLLQPKLSN